jgi:poly-gamma-glutamate synthase PgsB/CapB
MESIFIATGATILMAAGLEAEQAAVRRAAESIPHRVVVTGTRGKSSVTRLVAAGLRAGGLRTWAKATGSAPSLIFPDGSEQRIRRRASPSILEQGRLLRRAAGEGAEAIVFEAMSIHPETQRAEGRLILRPRILAVTNARLDHLGGAVRERSDVARMLLLSAPPGCRVLVPEEELFPGLCEACERADAVLVPVGRDSFPESGALVGDMGYPEFAVNLRLALATCAELSVSGGAVLAAMRGCRPDLGRFRLLRFRGDAGEEVLAASAFAANDPESTLRVLEAMEAREDATPAPGRKVWILNVRKDRGERTLQWIDTLVEWSRRACLPFEELLVIGDAAHGRAAARKLRKSGLDAEYLPGADPRRITARATRGSGRNLLFGIGNIAGIGGALVEYWASREAAS